MNKLLSIAILSSIIAPTISAEMTPEQKVEYMRSGIYTGHMNSINNHADRVNKEGKPKIVAQLKTAVSDLEQATPDGDYHSNDRTFVKQTLLEKLAKERCGVRLSYEPGEAFVNIHELTEVTWEDSVKRAECEETAAELIASVNALKDKQAKEALAARIAREKKEREEALAAKLAQAEVENDDEEEEA